MNKTLSVVICVVVMIFTPILIQPYLNEGFRNLFNPPGWVVLQPPYRVMSTVLCFIITFAVGYLCLRKGRIGKTGKILYGICSFVWCVFWAGLIWLIVTD